MQQLIVLLIFIFIFSGSVLSTTCPGSNLEVPASFSQPSQSGTKFYLIQQRLVTNVEAMTECQKLGGSLAWFDTKEDFDALDLQTGSALDSSNSCLTKLAKH